MNYNIMAATEFTLESVKDFMNRNGGKVKNHELVTYFKTYLNDVKRKDEMREKFKTFVNTLATIKVDEQNEKILVLKKKYRFDSGSVSQDVDRARSEPPWQKDSSRSHSSSDLTDSGPARVKSEGNLSASDLRLSTSTLASNVDGTSLGSAKSTSSLSSGTPDEDANASVVSVKERAKHLNRMESESELQQTVVSPIAATRFNKSKKISDGDDSTTSGEFTPLDPLEKEWVVKSSSADYHEMNQLLSKNPKLARVKDFTTTALHWAAKHGRAEVIKLLMGKQGVNVNQRTGYTALHLAAQQGHENIIELLVQGFKADPNIRDYSGKKAKQYLRTSASSRTQQLLTSSRLGSKMSSSKSENNNFMRNSGGRRSNRASAIKSLIQASASSMKQTVMRSSWGSLENVSGTPGSSPSVSPRNSAEPSPVQRRKGSFNNRDRDLMPPPSEAGKSRNRRPQTSYSKENLHEEPSTRQVSRSESEPNLGEATQVSRQSFI